MKFLTLADWTGIVETELFAQTHKYYRLAMARYPVLEVMAMVELFEDKRGICRGCCGQKSLNKSTMFFAASDSGFWQVIEINATGVDGLRLICN